MLPPAGKTTRGRLFSMAPGNNCRVHVHYSRTSHLDQAAVAGLLTRLAPDERERCARFVFERDRRDYAAAHVLLRESLSARGDRAPGDWRFEADDRGKPRLAEGSPRLFFNLSHTDGLVACAVSRDVDVGIDVERINHAAAHEDVYTRYFSDAEVAQLWRCAAEVRPARFIELWTLKEAYLKGVGCGLSIPLSSFGFQFGASSTLTFTAAAEALAGSAAASEWDFALFEPALGYRMALAVRIGAMPLTVMLAGRDPHPAEPVRVLRQSEWAYKEKARFIAEAGSIHKAETP